jgi:TM2 domain-containing membrane protein YozV
LSQSDTDERKTKFCVNCGAKIDVRAEICPKCGVRVAPPPAPARTEYVERKSSGLAAVLSFLFVGLGQIYNGEIGKGILFIIIGVIILFTAIILIGFILYPLFWIYNIYDAYNTAKKINAGQIQT